MSFNGHPNPFLLSQESLDKAFSAQRRARLVRAIQHCFDRFGELATLRMYKEAWIFEFTAIACDMILEKHGPELGPKRVGELLSTLYSER